MTSYRYSALLWGAILGFVIWGDVPDLWVAAGGVLTVGSGLFLLYQERR